MISSDFNLSREFWEVLISKNPRAHNERPFTQFRKGGSLYLIYHGILRSGTKFTADFKTEWKMNKYKKAKKL